MNIIKIEEGDTLEMKKPHPCGGKTMSVLRVGSELRLRCTECGRDMTVPRVKIEKSIKNVISRDGAIQPKGRKQNEQ